VQVPTPQRIRPNDAVSLESIQVTNVRCIEHAELETPAGLTLVWGPNGSGKTSLLEALFLVGRGRSFRTRNNERLIRDGTAHMRVTGRVSWPSGHAQVISLETTRERSTARVGGRTAQSLSELSQAFPVQAIEPGIHKLVEEASYHRRRWLDWAVFHVEPRFMDTWLRYTRALRQRNAALRAQTGQAGFWDAELARLGESIADSRDRLIEQLQPHWHDTASALSGLEVELHHLCGWNREQSLLEALAASRMRDEARRSTHVGPHRADVALRLRGRAAREVLSRGQQKLIAMAMTLAQIRLIRDATQTTPTLLLDDPAAELDSDHLSRFIGQVGRLQCQLVVTSLHAESRLFGAPDSTFRMEHGRVQPV